MYTNFLNLKLLHTPKPETHSSRLRKLISKSFPNATLLMLLIFTAKAAFAQCDPEAAFMPAVSGCVVDFQYTGQSALPNTATNITHEWKFFK
jgi:hypothetical protein